MPQYRNPLPIAFLVFAGMALPGIAPAQSQDHTQHESPTQYYQTRLTEPGNDVFGTVQEVIQQLESDPNTDWSEVDLEKLRGHLIDMRNFTLEVEVVSRESLAEGIQMIVASTTPEASGSLRRVLNAHPPMLERETGWNMAVDSLAPGRYELQITSPRPADAEKIQGLGYIGLMALGGHHQQHHWMIATGKSPHDHPSEQ